jgi:hypothetical protein
MYSNKRPQETPHKTTTRKIIKPNNTMELELISKPGKYKVFIKIDC